MALSESEPRRGLRELWSDEDGTASIEFLVLLPAYLVMITFSLSLGYLLLAHQSCQQAARVDGWMDGKNSSVLFLSNGTYDAGTVNTSNPTFVNDDFGPSANRDLLRPLLENRYGSGGHPITHRRRTVSFDFTGLLLGRASFKLSTASSVYTFTEGFEYPSHQRGQRDHFFGQERDLNPAYDPAEGPNNTYLSRRVNRHFSTGEGIWDTSPFTGRIDGSVDGEHQLYSRDRP